MQKDLFLLVGVVGIVDGMRWQGFDKFNHWEQAFALGAVGGVLHVAYIGAEQEDLGVGVTGVVGGEVFGCIFWEGAEPGADDDEVGFVGVVGLHGSWEGGWAVEGDFVG